MKSALIVLVFAACFSSRQAIAVDTLSVGQKAPPVVLLDLSGKRIYLRDYCGEKLRNPWKNKQKYHLILNFWATYCLPCKQEIPLLEKMMKGYGDKAKMLLISTDKKGAQVVKPFVKQVGFSSPVLLDIHGKTAERYGAQSLPSTFILDTNCIVQYRSAGFTGENDLEKFKTALQKLIDGTSAGKNGK